jgi:hypothetical protein
VLNLVRSATGFANHPDSSSMLYQLATTHASFAPSLPAMPNDWALAIQFPDRSGTASSIDATTVPAENLSNTVAEPVIDSAGNVWMRSGRNVRIEFVGGAACAGAPKAFIPIATAFESVP